MVGVRTMEKTNHRKDSEDFGRDRMGMKSKDLQGAY